MMRATLALALLVACGGSQAKPASEPPSNAAPATAAPADDTLSNAEPAPSGAAAIAEAQRRVDALAHELDELDGKVSAAVSMVVDAQNDADRAAAKERLTALQREQALLKEKLAAARAEHDRVERREGGFHHHPECMDNPLAAGC